VRLRGLVLPGPAADSAYTPAMRRWVCVFALLTGFSGQSYVWTVRPRYPVPIERQIEAPVRAMGTRLTADWWRRR
jgi:hypothetical protein